MKLMESGSDDEFFDCESEPVKYYAVAYQKDRGKGVVTTDINEARTKLKSTRGCRFSSFYDPLEAKRFADKPLSEESDNSQKKKASGTQKKLIDPFPCASPRDLNCLKLSIESGNLERVKEIVWNNPRHLVTESDSPTLLQIRFRHNALHVAVSFNQAEIVEFLLDSLSQLEFWQSIYPSSDDRNNIARMHRVIDMYLNSPEIGNLETPLHMASKFGNRECLRVLLKQQSIDTSLLNKTGQRADQIICSRCCGDFVQQRSEEIRQIFSEKFVVLLSKDGGRILQPVSHCELLRLLRVNNLETCADLISVKAYIGPLSENLANEVYSRWVNLVPEDMEKFEELRRSDAEKGMECHGRYLASLYKTQWKELWQFQNFSNYTNFADDEGLKLLEEHLEKMQHNETSKINDFDSTTELMISNDLQTSNHENNSSIYDSLRRMFSRLTLQSPIVNDTKILPPPSSPIRNKTQNRIRASEVITSTPIRIPKPSDASLRVRRAPFDTSLNGEGILTPIDRQVRRAIVSGNPERYTSYPRVAHWLDSLHEVDPLQFPTPSNFPLSNIFSPMNGKEMSMMMSTPIKSKNSFKQPPIPDFNKCLSPLSQIELPD